MNTYQKRNYKAGLKDGEFIEYYPEGKINMKGELHWGLKKWILEYYYINGKFDMKGRFMEDKQNGDWEYFYPNGQLYYEGSFVKGQKNKHGSFIIMMEKYGRKVAINMIKKWALDNLL